jgi:hypothetical protein
MTGTDELDMGRVEATVEEPSVESSAISVADSAGAVYRQYIEAQLDREGKHLASLQQRGVTVITTSGTLVSLLFAFAAVLNNFHVSRTAFTLPVRLCFAVALLLFLAAAVFGIMTNRPRETVEAAGAELERLLKPEYWSASGLVGSRRVAEVEVKVLRSERRQNDRVAKALRRAVSLEVSALFLLALAVLLILFA